MQTIYADLSFLINLIMDYAILWASGKISHSQIRHRRLLLASVLGALYALAQLYFGDSVFYSFVGKLLFSLLMVRVALPFNGWVNLGKQVLCFFGISFIAGGVALALVYASYSATWQQHWPWICLILALVTILLIGREGERWLFRRLMPNLLHYPIQIYIEEQCCEGAAFLDTGNGLVDPLSRKPVVVAEYRWFSEQMPMDFQGWLGAVSGDDILPVFSESSWANRVRMIPFSSVGKTHGLLVGLRCDRLVIGTGKKQVAHQDVVIALYPERLSVDNTYQALIPSAVLAEKM